MSQIWTPSHLWFCSFLMSWLYKTDSSSPSRIGAPFFNFNSWILRYTKSFYFVLCCGSHSRYISAIWGYFFGTSWCKCWAFNLITRVWWWAHAGLATRWGISASWQTFIIIHLHPWCLSSDTAFPKTNPQFWQKTTLTKWLSWFLHVLLFLLLTALRCNGAFRIAFRSLVSLWTWLLLQQTALRCNGAWCIAIRSLVSHRKWPTCWIPTSEHRFRATQYGISSKTAFTDQTRFRPGISLWIY